MMKLSQRRAQAKAAAEQGARAALQKQLADAVEGIAEQALNLLDLYDAGAVTPEQDEQLGALISTMKAELQPIAGPIDKAREILGILDEARAARA